MCDDSDIETHIVIIIVMIRTNTTVTRTDVAADSWPRCCCTSPPCQIESLHVTSLSHWLLGTTGHHCVWYNKISSGPYAQHTATCFRVGCYKYCRNAFMTDIIKIIVSHTIYFKSYLINHSTAFFYSTLYNMTIAVIILFNLVFIPCIFIIQSNKPIWTTFY
jgi:hypothetical protein